MIITDEIRNIKKRFQLKLPLHFTAADTNKKTCLAEVIKPKVNLVLSLADEIKLAMCSTSDNSQSDDKTQQHDQSDERTQQHNQSENSIQQDVTSFNEDDVFEPANGVDCQIKADCKDGLNKSMTSSQLAGINSSVAFEELGSPEHVEPPSFRDSGYYGNFDYNAEILKQQLQIHQQQQLLLRQLYKKRNNSSRSYYAPNANDCDSGYSTQNGEGQGQPPSTDPVLCQRCRSVTNKVNKASLPDVCNLGTEDKIEDCSEVNEESKVQSAVDDYYIDDEVPQCSQVSISGKVGHRKALHLGGDEGEDFKREVEGRDVVRNKVQGHSDDVRREAEGCSDDVIVIRKDQGCHEYTAEDRDCVADTYKKELPDAEAKDDDVSPSGCRNDDLTNDLMITHRCCHKFVPRHSDELFVEIGDPIFVRKEDDDLWCQGTNLRTKKSGIFPSVCATDLNFLEGEDDGTSRPVRFYVRLLGSVQVKYPKGSQVLSQAIQKVAMSRRMTMTSNPPMMCCLEITEQGIRLSDKKSRRMASSSRMPRSLSQILGKTASSGGSATEGGWTAASREFNHFFPLKNVTYCGNHPTNNKYFAFITKHPLELKYACHVLLAEESASCISEAIGASFKRYYQQYLASTHPTEDIYLEN